eukprot:gene3790-4715_t
MSNNNNLQQNHPQTQSQPMSIDGKPGSLTMVDVSSTTTPTPTPTPTTSSLGTEQRYMYPPHTQFSPYNIPNPSQYGFGPNTFYHQQQQKPQIPPQQQQQQTPFNHNNQQVPPTGVRDPLLNTQSMPSTHGQQQQGIPSNTTNQLINNQRPHQQGQTQQHHPQQQQYHQQQQHQQHYHQQQQQQQKEKEHQRKGSKDNQDDKTSQDEQIKYGGYVNKSYFPFSKLPILDNYKQLINCIRDGYITSSGVIIKHIEQLQTLSSTLEDYDTFYRLVFSKNHLETFRTKMNGGLIYLYMKLETDYCTSGEFKAPLHPFDKFIVFYSDIQVSKEMSNIYNQYLEVLLKIKNLTQSQVQVLIFLSVNYLNFDDPRNIMHFKDLLKYMESIVNGAERSLVHSYINYFIKCFQPVKNKKMIITIFNSYYHLGRHKYDDLVDFGFKIILSFVGKSNNLDKPVLDQLIDIVLIDLDHIDQIVLGWRTKLAISMINSLTDSKSLLKLGRLFLIFFLADQNAFFERFNKLAHDTKKTISRNMFPHVDKSNLSHVILLAKYVDLNISSSFLNSCQFGVLNLEQQIQVFNTENPSPAIQTIQNFWLSHARVEDLGLINLHLPKSDMLNISKTKLKFSGNTISFLSQREIEFFNNNNNLEPATTEYYKNYHDICSSFMDRYINLRGPDLNYLPENDTPPTLIYLLLFNHYFQSINYQNIGSLVLDKRHKKLGNINVSGGMFHWLKEVKTYINHLQMFRQSLQALYLDIHINYSTHLKLKYEILSDILIKFGEKNIESPEAVNSRYNKDQAEYTNLTKIQSWLSDRYNFKFNDLGFIQNLPIAQRVDQLRDCILRSRGNGYTIQKVDSIQFLSTFLQNDNCDLFNIIFEFYSKMDTRSIDKICQEAKSFLQKLVSADPTIQLNQIFQDITKRSKNINFEKELKNIFTFFNPGKIFANYNQVLLFINQATSLFGITTNIHYMWNFLESSPYILIEDYQTSKNSIHRLIQSVSSNNTVETSKDTLNKITESLGGLEHKQLEFFKFINNDLIDFFAQFKDQSVFDKTTDIITSNLIADQINWSLVNFTIYTQKILKGLTSYRAIWKEDNEKKQVFTSLAAFCNDAIRSILPEDLETCLNKVNGISSKLSHVKGLYSSAGGTYTSESILPTVSLILKASDFISKISKTEDGSIGWSIKIKEPYMEFSQDKVEDFLRGLKIFSSRANEVQDKVIKTFEQVFALLQEIHKKHRELDILYHPRYDQGSLTISISSVSDDKKNQDSLSAKTITDLQIKRQELIDDIEQWKRYLWALPNQLWFLRSHGISSLTSKFQRIYDTRPINYENLSKEMLPYIQYCFPLAKCINLQSLTQIITNNMVDLLPPKQEALQFFTKLIPLIVDFIEENAEYVLPISVDREPYLIQINEKSNLFNYLMQLNGQVLPHPSQLFYSSTFSVDKEFFFKLVESFQTTTFFLIGVVQEKDSLIKWLTDHYSKNSIKELARVYIISSEKNSDIFSFLPRDPTNFTDQWLNFKKSWEISAKSNCIHELNLVSGQSGSGKTHYVKLQIGNKTSLKVHIRPNFDLNSFVDKIYSIINNKDTNGTKELCIHFILSPYCEFEHVNYFFYPLITHGFIFGTHRGEIIKIPDWISLRIYIEIGPPLDLSYLNENQQKVFNINNTTSKEEIDKYVKDSIPLIYHLANKLVHSDTEWEITDVERKCFSYINGTFYQKPTLQRGRSVTLEQYFDHVNNIHAKYAAKTQLLSNPSFLIDRQFLLQRKNFFRLMEERLKFLDDYYDYYLLVGRENSNSQSGLLTFEDLYYVLLLESVQLSDPNYSSARSIWDKPPMITSRFHKQIAAVSGMPPIIMCTINYIDFSRKGEDAKRVGGSHPLLGYKVSGLYSQYEARIRQEEFRATIVANSFGVESRTMIVNDLCEQYGFVMTPDLALRLLILHDKIKNQRSLVLSGDTGVGKTYILIFYSLLINAMNEEIPDIIYSLKEQINDIISKNPGFILQRVERDRTSCKKLPGNVTIDELLDSVSQLVDYEPPIPKPAEPAEPAPLPGSDKQLVNPVEVKRAFLVGEEQQNQAPGEKPPELVEHIQAHKDKIFKQLEACIRALMEKFALISIPQEGSLREMKDKPNSFIIQKKEKLIQTLRECCTVKFKNLYHRIIMNTKFSSKEFKQFVNRIIQESKELHQIDPTLKMVVFIDEFNTSPVDTLSLINEIFVDGTLDGENVIPNNIFWIGAMNPPKLSLNSVNYTGVNQAASMSNLAFVVKATPPSMKQMFFEYGEFTSENEDSFLDCLFQLKRSIVLGDYTPHLKEMIMRGQNAIRKAQQDRTHVSIRDITRAIDIYQFFNSKDAGYLILRCFYAGLQANSADRHWLSIICSFTMTYYLRLSHDLRFDMIIDFDEFIKENCPIKTIAEKSFYEIFQNIMDLFVSPLYTKLPDGIALTDSLRLNIFCTVVAINCKIPLCIIGPPGCSKTLSFSIVLDNLVQSNKNTIKADNPYANMPNAYPFRYQSTPHTTDIEIKSKFDQAIERQRMYDGNKDVCVVFLDEAGLVNENHSPMKVMHDYLDKVAQKSDKKHLSTDIAIIILSNKVLDAAKTNRMLVLIHPPGISESDEKSLVRGCLYNNKVSTEYEEMITNGLSKAYKNVNNYSKDIKENLFHQRDFVFFLRHLKQYSKITPETLLKSLERNFSGIPYNKFKELAKEFFRSIQLPLPDAELFKDNTITRISEALTDKIDDGININTSPFRYMMLFDPTENESSLAILRETGIKFEVIRVGGFEKDTTSEALVEVVSQIKNAMATGGTIVLVNTQLIDTCFYDVFNRFFTTMTVEDNKVQYIASVSFGTHFIFCPVHPNFKIIVHMPLSRIHSTHLPWLNRFEKYILSIDQLLAYYMEHKVAPDKRRHITLLSESVNHFVNEFHFKITNQSLLSGFTNETIDSIIFSFAKDPESLNSITPYRVNPSEQQSENEEPTPQLRLLNWKLLQLARPESILKCKSLPRQYIEEYILRQEHFNCLRFLHHLFSHFIDMPTIEIPPTPMDNQYNPSNKWFIYTRSSLALHRLRESENVDKFYKILIPNHNEQNPKVLKFIQLNTLPTSAQCNLEITKFIKSDVQKICITVADMSMVNLSQINYVLNLTQDLPKDKLLVVICHSPPEFSLYNQSKLNSIFLNGIEYIYIDSLGVKIDATLTEGNQVIDTDIRTWIAKSYGLNTDVDLSTVSNSFQSIFFELLVQVSLQMNPTVINFQLPPKARTFYLNRDARAKQIVELFEKHPIWHQTIIGTFITHWRRKNVFNDIISTISTMILTGKSVHSFIDSIKNAMISYLYPVISKIFRFLVNHDGYAGLMNLDENHPDQDIANLNKEVVQMIALFIKSIKIIKVAAKVEHRFEPITLNAPIVYGSVSNLPLFDSIYNNLTQMFSMVLDRVKVRNPGSVFNMFVKFVETSPIKDLVVFISQSGLTDLFKADFVIRIIKSKKECTQFFITLLDLLAPQGSKDTILHYWVTNYFYSSTISFVKGLISPIINLENLDKKSKFDELINMIRDPSLLIKNTTQLKLIIIKFSVTILINHIGTIFMEYTKDIPDDADFTKRNAILLNWIKSVREIFNKSPVENILAVCSNDQNELFNISKVNVIFNILNFTCVKNDMVSLFPHYVEVLIKTRVTDLPLLNFKEVFQLFYAINCNLAAQNQPTISLDWHDQEYPNELSMAKEIPFGWYCYVIKTYLLPDERKLKEIKDYFRIFDGQIILFMAPFEGHITENIKNFFGKDAASIKSQHTYPITDYLYYVLLDLRMNSGLSLLDLMNLRKQFLPQIGQQQDLYDKIEEVAVNTAMIHLLAQHINREGIEFTTNMLNKNPELATTLKSILNSQPQVEKRQAIENKRNQLFMCTKIINETTLLELLKCDVLLDKLGMNHLSNTDSVELNDNIQFSFIFDNSEEGLFYQKIRNAIRTNNGDISSVLDEASKSEKLKGLFRTSLLLLIYQDYLKGLNLDPYRNIVNSNDKTVESVLKLSIYRNFYLLILEVEIEKRKEIPFFETLVKNDNKSLTTKTIAQLIVNFVAISIGVPNNCYLHYLTSDSTKVAAKYFPACDIENKFRDCGMRYREDNGGINQATKTMNGNLLYKYMVNATSWSIFAWTVSSMGTTPMANGKTLFEYWTNHNQLHFVSWIQREKTNILGLTDYVSLRGLTALNETLIDQELTKQLIEPGHLLSEYVLELFRQSYVKNNPNSHLMLAEFQDQRQVSKYENYLITEIIDKVIKRYPTLKDERALAIQHQSSSFFNLLSIRKEYTLYFTSPFYSLDYINDIFTKNIENDQEESNLPLLKEFSSKIEVICLSRYFPDIINFLNRFYHYFNLRLPHDYIFKNFKDCIDFLIEEEFETQESVAPLQKAWNNLLVAWEAISSHSKVLQGGCNAMAQYEKIISPIDNDTPIIQLIFNKDSNGNGLLLDYLIDWMNKNQSVLLTIRDSSPKIQLSETFKDIMNGFESAEKVDLSNMSFDSDDNSLFIGSHFTPIDFQAFLAKMVSRFQTFSREQFNPDWKSIELKTIYTFLSGKSYSNSFAIFMKEFPFKPNHVGKPSMVEKKENFTKIVPVSIKELQSLLCKLDSNFNQSLGDNTQVFAHHCKTTHHEQLEFLCRFLSSTIVFILNETKIPIVALLEMSILEFAKSTQCIPIDHIEDRLLIQIDRIKINSIHKAAEITIEGYLSFAYLYNSIVDDPKGLLNLEYTRHMEQFKSNILQEALGDGLIVEFIQFFKEIIKRLTSEETKARLKQNAVNDLFYESVSDQLSNLVCPSKYYTIQTMFPKNLTIIYFAPFMRNIHEILSTLYIQSQETNAVEFYKEYNGANDNEPIPENPNEDDDAQADQIFNEIEEEEAEIPVKPWFGGIDEVGDEEAPEEEELEEFRHYVSVRPIKPLIEKKQSDTPYLQVLKYVPCLFNWIRYLPEKISITRSKNYETLFQRYIQFQSDCSKYYKSQIDIQKLWEQFVFKFENVNSFENQFLTLTSILSVLSKLDNSQSDIKNLFMATTSKKCPCGDPPLELPFYFKLLSESNFETFTSSRIIELFKTRVKMSRCSKCNKESSVVSFPQFIFIGLDRKNQSKFNDTRFTFNGDISIYNTIYRPHSALCIDNTMGKNDEYYIHINVENNNVIRCSNNITISPKTDDLETIERNCVLLIYQKILAPNIENEMSEIFNHSQVSHVGELNTPIVTEPIPPIESVKKSQRPTPPHLIQKPQPTSTSNTTTSTPTTRPNVSQQPISPPQQFQPQSPPQPFQTQSPTTGITQSLYELKAESQHSSPLSQTHYSPNTPTRISSESIPTSPPTQMKISSESAISNTSSSVILSSFVQTKLDIDTLTKIHQEGITEWVKSFKFKDELTNSIVQKMEENYIDDWITLNSLNENDWANLIPPIGPRRKLMNSLKTIIEFANTL